LAALVVLGVGAALVVRGRGTRSPAPVAVSPPAPNPHPITPPETVRITVPIPAPPAPDSSRAVTPAPPPEPPAPETRPVDDVRARRRFAAAQVVALGLRTRARNRGADPAALQAGDVTARRADSLARAGDYAAAGVELRSAQQQWIQAEQAAAGAVQAYRTPAGASDRTEIEGVIAGFAEAFRSRDLSRIRRAYPGMTPAQAQEWGTFFMDARNLDARLEITSLDQSGDEATAQLTGGLDWESLQTGRAESRTVSYRARLVRERAGWRLNSLR
jgi:hypothetical protein